MSVDAGEQEERGLSLQRREWKCLLTTAREDERGGVVAKYVSELFGHLFWSSGDTVAVDRCYSSVSS